jgi:hypothetical protein
MKQILISKNLNYAASKTSTTADTATSPELLRDGAIGFYLPSGTLIPAAGTGMSTAEKFFIAQGTSTGCIVTPLLDKRSNLKRKMTQDYTAPVRQVSYVGYNTSTGSLNTPTISARDEASIKVIDTTVGRQTFPKQTFSVSLAASADDYTVASGLVDNINLTPFSDGSSGSNTFVTAEVVTNATLAEFDADVTVTNGSKTVTFAGNDTTYGGGATALVVGDYLVLRGITYKATAVVSGTVTIDRYYMGSTETIAVASTVNAAARGTSITEAGVKLTAEADGKHFRLAVGGVIETATITYTTPFNPGSGTAAQVAQLEKDFLGFSRGSWNRVGPYAAFGAPTLFADSSATYDLFNITTINQYSDKSGMNSTIGEELYVIVAIHASATTANSALDTIVAAI